MMKKILLILAAGLIAPGNCGVGSDLLAPGRELIQ